MSIRNGKIKVYEMTCTSCEYRVEKAIKQLYGVKYAKASYSGQFAEVQYDSELCNLYKIKAAIKRAGYSTQSSNDLRFMGILIAAAAIVLLGLNTSGFDMEAKLTNASYAVLFVVGVFTSIHCVGMCGGIMLSQTLSKNSTSKFEAIQPAILYNSGRVVSYTILGGIIGALGSVFSLSIIAKSAMQIFAGVFMIIMGLNMTGLSAFRKFHIKLPQFACKAKNKSGSPFIVGLLNGFMPCGPLQTMQLFALGTGSAGKGALAMFAFSIGTVPLMLTFGAVSGLLSKGYTKKILKFSGVLIIVLGLIMGNRGLALAGININPITPIADNSGTSSNTYVAKATLQDGIQVINMTADNNGYTPNTFYVQKGTPVKWVIDGKEMNSCNNALVARDLNLEWKIKKGKNIKEFTPGNKDINFSCWMGMISGVIKVVDNLDTINISKTDPAVSSPKDGDSSQPSQPSIYGSDLSQIPTEILINKALVNGKDQIVTFKGIGYELLPLIAVTSNSGKTKLTFDLNDFDNAQGQYYILDMNTGEKITSFMGKRGINSIELIPPNVGGYAILIGDYILGVVEVVDNIKDANLEEIRKLYLP
ncbi:MAG: heavy metal transport/detoxification protein [Clostridiales bacterium GWB2_37_7]|nr:MAG: heavy metal transport/detoxification protein [Clostridiales bacterium GWB2_37_7]